MKTFFPLILACLVPFGANGQVLDNSALNGKYYFVHILAQVSGGTASARNLGGSITFDSNGGFSFDGELGAGAGAPQAASGSGSYSVAENGFVTFTNPISNSLEINGRLGVSSEVLIGASTEAIDGSYDLFVAIKAPTGGVSDTTLNGAYTGGTLCFPDGSENALKTALISFSADGNGNFTSASATGHAADQQDINDQQGIGNATYSLTGDGSGTASLGLSSTLFFGNRNIFTSADGNYLIGYSTESGGREIFLATRNFSSSADDSDWVDNYWIAEIVIDTGFDSASNSHASASGALRSNGAGAVSISERLRFDFEAVDFSGVNFYSINSDGTGFLGGFLEPGVVNMAIGAPSTGQAQALKTPATGQPGVREQGGPVPQAFVGATIGGEGQISTQHGIFFGVRVPEITGQGVFLAPLGVLNAASFAPPTYPISGGTLLSLFGSGLAPSEATAETTPLPTSLAGISVTINRVLAPLFFVSAGQINLQTPFSTSGTSATIVVNNNGELSNEVVVPVDASSPGIFSVEETGIGPGVLTHADFRLITEANPALPGETIVIFLTGVGALNPPVVDGAPGPADPLSFTTDPNVAVLFGGEEGRIFFSGAAPFFVGLYQINVTIPDTVFPGPAVPVAIATSNAFSDFVDVTIGFQGSAVSRGVRPPGARKRHPPRMRAY